MTELCFRGRGERWKYLMLLFLLFFFAENCSSPANERFHPSGVNSDFSFSGKSFNEYAAYSRKMIEEARTDLDEINRETIVDGNSPLALTPTKNCSPGKSHPYARGILLSHGLTDSPYTMKRLAQFFRKECFFVEVLLLPGHGTRPGDLLEVTWEEWGKAFSFGVDALKENADEVYLGGFSTGATLSVHHAMKDDSIRGLFLFSPALKITGKARFACWLSSLGRVFPRLRWLGHLQPDINPFKYQSFSANAACQIYHLTKAIEGTMGLSPLHTPMFIAASEDDTTVEIEGTMRFFSSAISRKKRMILYGREDHQVPEGVTLVKSRMPDTKISSSSHMAIVLPPEDPFFGERGKSPICTHYFGKDDEAYFRCMNGTEDILGETIPEFMSRGVVRRLSYNPFFDSRLGDMKDFISRIE